MSSADIEAEVRRRTENRAAWTNYGGYRTTSGCPCWDKTPNLCIPKYLGCGWSPNFWAIFCCCFCDKAVSEDPADVNRDFEVVSSDAIAR